MFTLILSGNMKEESNKETYEGIGNKIYVQDENGKMVEITISKDKESGNLPKGFPVKLVIPFKPSHLEFCHKDKKRKCVECENFYKLRQLNPFHKTAYCKTGEKSVNIISDKSIACDKIKPIQFMFTDLI